MQISRWGNSLAIRIPAAVVERLSLKEGDDVVIDATDAAHFRIARDTTRDDALDGLRRLGWVLPPGDRVFREEANSRGR
jgi:antitoxin MazE